MLGHRIQSAVNSFHVGYIFSVGAEVSAVKSHHPSYFQTHHTTLGVQTTPLNAPRAVECCSTSRESLFQWNLSAQNFSRSPLLRVRFMWRVDAVWCVIKRINCPNRISELIEHEWRHVETWHNKLTARRASKICSSKTHGQCAPPHKQGLHIHTSESYITSNLCSHIPRYGIIYLMALAFGFWFAPPPFCLSA